MDVRVTNKSTDRELQSNEYRRVYRLSGLLLTSCSLCNVGDFRETPRAMQIEYRHGVTHTDRVGHLQLVLTARSARFAFDRAVHYLTGIGDMDNIPKASPGVWTGRFPPFGVRIYRFTM
jgi:hypothetical protein